MPKTVLTLSLLTTLVLPLWALDTEDDEESAKKKPQFPSPDGQFAFRYEKAETDDDEAVESFHLIEASSGKHLLQVAKSNPELGPSARFEMDVLWREDGKAFAVKATLWKRGSDVLVFMRNGAKFREVKLPKLKAEVPAKAKKGRKLVKTTELDAQSPKEWQKDGSLVMEIETQEYFEEGPITALRTVVLAINNSGKAKVLKSSTKTTVGDVEE